jgi:hypothetical protein
VKRFQGATKGSYRMTQHREFNGVQVWLFETDSSVVH